ncbi:MAG: hypothetical protein R3D03_07560 [Geminicoccaceae bacterium]
MQAFIEDEEGDEGGARRDEEEEGAVTFDASRRIIRESRLMAMIELMRTR